MLLDRVLFFWYDFVLPMALMLRMRCFCIEVDQNSPHKVLPFICFEIYGLGGSGADEIHCGPIFQGFKMTKNV